MLNLKKTREDDNLTVSLEGRLDTNTSPELEAFLKDELDGVKNIVLDFAGLEYISSAGLRVLLSTQKRIMGNGTLKLINVNDVIKNIFDTTGFSDILTIE